MGKPTINGKRRNTLMALGVWGVLSLACVWAWTPAFINISNTIEYSGRWWVAKMRVGNGLMGSYSFFSGPQALAFQHLNLGAWQGFQRVIMKDALQTRSLELKYNFPQKDYLLILLNYSKEGFDALKIPSVPSEDAMLLRVKNTGEFLAAQPFSLAGRKSDVWNTAKLILESERIGISINDGSVAWLDIHLNTKQNFGFQSGGNGVLLDDIVVYGGLGQTLFRESFDNEHIRNKVQWWLFLGIVAGSLVLALAMRALRLFAAAILSNLIAVQISLIAGGLVISNIYLPTLSAKYPSMGIFLMNTENNWVTENRQKVYEKLEARYSAKAELGTLRIVLVGSSQTAGHGATHEGDGMVEQLEQVLNNAGDLCHFECVNFGFNGSWSKWLLEDYEKLAPQMKPDVCVINLSNNDGTDERFKYFEDNLRSFVKYNREHNIETVFVKEALCAEALPGDAINHVRMQAVANELGVTVVESHRILGEHINDGLLWWDFVHPTSFGHSLIAKAIAETLQKEVLPKLCEKESAQK